MLANWTNFSLITIDESLGGQKSYLFLECTTSKQQQDALTSTLFALEVFPDGRGFFSISEKSEGIESKVSTENVSGALIPTGFDKRANSLVKVSLFYLYESSVFVMKHG